jgi:tetratricopeptide (TPR) repeat protein
MIGTHFHSKEGRLAFTETLLLVCSLVFLFRVPGLLALQEKTEDPDLPALRSLIEKGHPAEALRQLNVLAAKQPEPAGVERLRGMAFYAQGNFAAADQAFAAALRQDSKDPEAGQMRGITLFRLGRPAEAIPILETVHEWSPTTKIDPSYVLALCYIDVHRYDDARHALARQYGFEPDSASAYLIAARIFLRRENLSPAQNSAQKAIELNPQLPLAHLLLGEVALSAERLNEAIAEFEKERAVNPLYGGVYDRLGDAYSRAGDYQKAQQALERALLLEPYATGPYILLGKVLLRRQDPASAASYLERAEKMDPSNYMTHSFLSQAYRAMGRTEDAAREAAAAQKLQAAERPQPESAP